MSDDEIRDELDHLAGIMAKIERDGPCPICGRTHVIYKDAVSDFPGYMTRLLMCNDCGVVIFWEEELDSAGRRIRAKITKLRYGDEPDAIRLRTGQIG